MLGCQMNKHTTEEALERYKGEIWETQEKHQYVCSVLQTKFFNQRGLIRSLLQFFKQFWKTLQTFKIQADKRKC